MLRHTGRNDWRRVLKLFRECEFTRVERKVIVATAKAEVTTMLTRHWSSVLAVADALRTKRTLTGEETKRPRQKHVTSTLTENVWPADWKQAFIR